MFDLSLTVGAPTLISSVNHGTHTLNSYDIHCTAGGDWAGWHGRLSREWSSYAELPSRRSVGQRLARQQEAYMRLHTGAAVPEIRWQHASSTTTLDLYCLRTGAMLGGPIGFWGPWEYPILRMIPVPLFGSSLPGIPGATHLAGGGLPFLRWDPPSALTTGWAYDPASAYLRARAADPRVVVYPQIAANLGGGLRAVSGAGRRLLRSATWCAHDSTAWPAHRPPVTFRWHWSHRWEWVGGGYPSPAPEYWGGQWRLRRRWTLAEGCAGPPASVDGGSWLPSQSELVSGLWTTEAVPAGATGVRYDLEIWPDYAAGWTAVRRYPQTAWTGYYYQPSIASDVEDCAVRGGETWELLWHRDAPAWPCAVRS